MGAPPWAIVSAQVRNIIRGHDVITYNAAYDRKMMHLSDDAHGFERIDYGAIANWYCAMEWYAELWGDWNRYRKSYRWQRLTAAMVQQGLPESNAHSALGDCLMTLSLIRRLTSKTERIITTGE